MNEIVGSFSNDTVFNACMVHASLVVRLFADVVNKRDEKIRSCLLLCVSIQKHMHLPYMLNINTNNKYI